MVVVHDCNYIGSGRPPSCTSKSELCPTCSPRGHDIRSLSTNQGRFLWFLHCSIDTPKTSSSKTPSPSVLTIVRFQPAVMVIPNIAGLLPAAMNHRYFTNPTVPVSDTCVSDTSILRYSDTLSILSLCRFLTHVSPYRRTRIAYR